MSVTFQKIKAPVVRMWVTKQGYLGKSCQVGRKLPSWAKVAKLGKNCQVERSFAMTTTKCSTPPSDWQRALVQLLRDDFYRVRTRARAMTTLNQLWDNFKTTWWPPQYRSWAQVRCSATPGTQTGRLWLSPTAIGRWRWSRRTCKHFAPLCSTVWQCVTLCNTLQHTSNTCA